MPRESTARLPAGSEAEAVALTLQERGEAYLKVRGTSMLPRIRPGDILIVRRVAVGDLKPGDTILFVRRASVMAHRLVHIEHAESGPRFATRGDAVADLDPPLRECQILGRAEGVQRGACQINLNSPFELLRARLLARVPVVSVYFQARRDARQLFARTLQRIILQK